MCVQMSVEGAVAAAVRAAAAATPVSAGTDRTGPSFLAFVEKRELCATSLATLLRAHAIVESHMTTTTRSSRAATRREAAEIRPRDRREIAERQPGDSREMAEIQPRYSRGAAEVQPRYGAEMQPRSSVGESDYRFLGRG